MSLGPIAGIAGKIKALVALFPTDNLTKVNRIDVTLSTRASSAEVAKAANWTAGLATQVGTNLDIPVSQVKMLYKSVVLTTGTSWAKPAKMIGDIVLVSMIGGGGKGNASATFYGGSGGKAIQKVAYNVGAGPVTYGIGIGATSSSARGSSTTFGSLTCIGGWGGAVGANDPGGAQGGLGGNNMLAESASGPYGGQGGGVRGSADSGGGGGLVFDTLAKAHYLCGSGYGAGSGGHSSGVVNGVDGAILLEWTETP
jgi:hypothetical protein